jgi:hypothetical protein
VDEKRGVTWGVHMFNHPGIYKLTIGDCLLATRSHRLLLVAFLKRLGFSGQLFLQPLRIGRFLRRFPRLEFVHPGRALYEFIVSEWHRWMTYL